MTLPQVPGFILVSKIGSGTFSEVYKGHRFVNSCKQVVAVKCITKRELSATTVNSIIQEIEALKLLRHPHIIHMIDFCWDDKSIYIIMEYCGGGDLSVFIRSHKHLEEKICKSFLCQLASALQYLRQHNIAHMDLKPSNLLLTSGRNPVLKLADFGLAQSLKSRQRETSFRGSPLYMAPEILRRESYDASVDLWSTGVILYECLFGKPPCSSSSLKEVMETIQSRTAIIIPTTKNISRDCRDLLVRLLEKDPNKRLTFEEFFNHPFVSLEEMKSSDGGQRRKSVCAQASLSHDSNVKMSQTFQQLHSLASTTPDLLSSLKIGLEGVQYDAEGQHTVALERYKAALEKMIPLLRSECKGARRDLLRHQITLWMERAEQLQLFCDLQQSNFEDLQSGDATGNDDPEGWTRNF